MSNVVALQTVERGVHPLDAAIALRTLAPGRYAAAPSADYWNLAGPFGGMLAALVLKAVLDHPERQGRPLAQTVNFAAAITAEPVELHVWLARGGRSTQHWNVELSQAGLCALTASVVTGMERTTWGHEAIDPPEIPAPLQVPAFPAAKEGWPGWFANYEMRFQSGAPGFRKDGENRSGGTRAWLRDHPTRPLDYLSLAALADAFAPRGVIVRGRHSPAAAVTLSTYFVADSDEVAAQGVGYVLGAADLRVARHGFSDQSAALWSEGGVLLALSHQVVWFKD